MIQKSSRATKYSSSSLSSLSSLNMAEIELSVLNRQCLDRRIPDMDSLKEEIATWEENRNQNSARVDWRFTTADDKIMS